MKVFGIFYTPVCNEQLFHNFLFSTRELADKKVKYVWGYKCTTESEFRARLEYVQVNVRELEVKKK
jgi:hypothetical protein